MADRDQTPSGSREERGPLLELERHVLGSPANAFDTAWTSYGWTPALASRSGRLEEMVPWGTPSTRKEAPGWLSGDVDEVAGAANIDRLGSAVLPIDGSLGYSVWGASRRERSGSGWRILTHTVLLDRAAFAHLSGHPEGLLGAPGRAPEWLRSLVEDESFEAPTELRTIALPATRDEETRFRRERLRSIARLRKAVLEQWSVGELAETLAALFEGLATVLSEGSSHHVVVRQGGESASRLIRLAWLSLPLADREKVGYATEQSRTERPRGHLIGLAPDEWGDTVPDGSILVDSHHRSPGTGRREWATLVSDPTLWESFIQADRRAGASGLRLVAGDDLTAVAGQRSWRSEWVARGPTLDGALRLLENEVTRGRGPRLRAAGVVLAEALRNGDEGDLNAVLRAAAALEEDDRMRWLGGAVRRLRGMDRAGFTLAARIRLLAATRFGGLAGHALHLLVDRESDALRALLSTPDGGRQLMLGSLALAQSGDAVGRELVRLGASEARWDARLVAEIGERCPEPVLVDVLAAVAESAESDVERVGALTGLLQRAMTGGPSIGGVGRLLRAIPVDRFSDAWEGCVAALPIDLLRNPSVLAGLVEATHAGQATWSEEGPPDGRARVAWHAVSRLLEEGAAGAPAETILRLVWAACTPELLDRIPAGARVATLTDLLAAPAPMPLYLEIRRRIPLGQPESQDVATGTLDALRAYAPAVALALAGSVAAPRRRAWVEVTS